MSSLTSVPVGTPVVVGQSVVPMPAVGPRDRVIPVVGAGELLVIGEEAYEAARQAVEEADAAQRVLTSLPSTAVDAFFTAFAGRLADDGVWGRIAEANAADVSSAGSRGRSTTRLVATEKMRADMIAGLRGWAGTKSRIGEVVERREADGYVIERRRAPLGVVAFVFEGRPNVFADGAGVVRNGNTSVMRIGADALGTALAIESHALRPALRQSGLPESCVRLVRHKEHGAGQALFTLPKVRLAVARGSGKTVELLGSIAEQHGIPASLHGRGGAWMYVEASADPVALENAIVNSLDRKVCNTLNVLCLEEAAKASLGPIVERALRKVGAKVHVVSGSEGVVTGEQGFARDALGTEWEWEKTPEVSFVLVGGMTDAAELFSKYSPRFVASLISTRPGAFEEFYSMMDSPYVGNAFTRWVDGQWAYSRPELGLTNWERGRLLGRSGFLSGDDIVTVRDVFLDRTGKSAQRR